MTPDNSGNAIPKYVPPAPLKHYVFNYAIENPALKEPAQQANIVIPPMAFKFLQIAATNIWDAIEKVKTIYPDYQSFEVGNITEII